MPIPVSGYSVCGSIISPSPNSECTIPLNRPGPLFGSQVNLNIWMCCLSILRLTQSSGQGNEVSQPKWTLPLKARTKKGRKHAVLSRSSFRRPNSTSAGDLNPEKSAGAAALQIESAPQRRSPISVTCCGLGAKPGAVSISESRVTPAQYRASRESGVGCMPKVL